MKPLLLMLGCLSLVACGEKEKPPEPIRPVLSMKVQTLDQLDLGRFAGTIQALSLIHI